MKAKLRFFKSEKPRVSYIFAIVMAAVMVLQTSGAFAQKVKQYDEAGFFLGLGYYNGEINPVKPMYNPKVAIGLNIRHALNDRIAFAFHAVRCKLEGADKDFSDPYQKARNASFANELIELSLQGEFNFLPLVPGDPIKSFTPFIAGGPGMAVASFPQQGLRFCIPFGFGIKYCPNDRVTLTAEWKYRKLFSDGLDNIADDQYDLNFGKSYAKQKSTLGNDDWYSFIGLGLWFNMGGSTKDACPAFR